MGPDLRVNMRPMGPPVIATGAPVMNPHVPYVPGTPSMLTQGQMAAQVVNYNTLRGFAQGSQQSLSCKGCGVDGPSLRDVAPPSLYDRAPRWMKVAGALAGFGLVLGLVIYFARR